MIGQFHVCRVKIKYSKGSSLINTLSMWREMGKSFIKFIYGDKPTWARFSLHRFLYLRLAQILACVNQSQCGVRSECSVSPAHRSWYYTEPIFFFHWAHASLKTYSFGRCSRIKMNSPTLTFLVLKQIKHSLPELLNDVFLQVIRSSICVLLVITATVFPAVTLLAGQGLGRVLYTHIEPSREQVARVTACLVLLVPTVTAQVRNTTSHTEAHKAFALLCFITVFIFQTLLQK